MESYSKVKCEIHNHTENITSICLNEICNNKKLCCSKCITKLHLDCANKNLIIFLSDITSSNYKEIFEIPIFEKYKPFSQYFYEFEEDSKHEIFISKLETNFNDITMKINQDLNKRKNEMLEMLDVSQRKVLIAQIKQNINYLAMEGINESKINELILNCKKNFELVSKIPIIKYEVDNEVTNNKLNEMYLKISLIISEYMILHSSSDLKFSKKFCPKYFELSENCQKLKKISGDNSLNEVCFFEYPFANLVRFSVQCSGISLPNGDCIELGLAEVGVIADYENFYKHYHGSNGAVIAIASSNYNSGKNFVYNMKQIKGGPIIDFNEEELIIEFDELNLLFTVSNKSLSFIYQAELKKNTKYYFFALLYDIGNQVVVSSIK